MGSVLNPNSPCTFAMDLTWVSKFILIFVQVAGRTRDLPSRVDSVLTVVKPVGAEEVLNETWLNRESAADGLDGGGEGGGEGEIDGEDKADLEEGGGRDREKKDGGGDEGGPSTPLLRDFNGSSGGGVVPTPSKRGSRVTFGEIKE